MSDSPYICLMAENREVTKRQPFPVWVAVQGGKKIITPGREEWEYKHKGEPIDITHVRLWVDEDSIFDYPIQMETIAGVLRAKWFKLHEGNSVVMKVKVNQQEKLDADQAAV